MADEDNLIESLREKGLTCNKLKALENRERREKQSDLKQANIYRAFGFSNASQTKEKVGAVQGKLADQMSILRKKVCGGLR